MFWLVVSGASVYDLLLQSRTVMVEGEEEGKQELHGIQEAERREGEGGESQGQEYPLPDQPQ